MTYYVAMATSITIKRTLCETLKLKGIASQKPDHATLNVSNIAKTGKVKTYNGLK